MPSKANPCSAHLKMWGGSGDAGQEMSGPEWSMAVDGELKRGQGALGVLRGALRGHLGALRDDVGGRGARGRQKT